MGIEVDGWLMKLSKSMLLVCGWMKKKDGSGRGEILSTPAVRRVIGVLARVSA